MKPLYSGGYIVFPQGSTVLGNVSYAEENMGTISINNRFILTINLKSITLTSKRSSLYSITGRNDPASVVLVWFSLAFIVAIVRVCVVRGCANCSGILGSSRVISVLTSYKRNLIHPLHFSATSLQVPITMTN